jgi:hypothetical protein
MGGKDVPITSHWPSSGHTYLWKVTRLGMTEGANQGGQKKRAPTAGPGKGLLGLCLTLTSVRRDSTAHKIKLRKSPRDLPSVLCHAGSPSTREWFAWPTLVDASPALYRHPPVVIATDIHKSVAGHDGTVPPEPIVDPELHHLDVAVVSGESVAGEKPGRNRKRPDVQP